MSTKRQRGTKVPRASQSTGDGGSGSSVGSGEVSQNSHTDEFWDRWLSVGGGVAVGTAAMPEEGTVVHETQAPEDSGAESTRSEMETLCLMSLVDALDGSRMDGFIRAYVEASDEVIRGEVSGPEPALPDLVVTAEIPPEPEVGANAPATTEEREARGAA